MQFFLRGLLIGFSIAAPVGPIGVLCMRRTLANGRWSGFVSGLGAATADAVYGAIAGFGLTAVTIFLTGQELALRLIGGIFLVWLGAKTCRSQPATQAAAGLSPGLTKDYFSTLALTITNPATILSFVAVFAGLGLADTHNDWPTAASLIAGVFLGSAAWWLILCVAIGALREKLNPARLRWVNRLSGGVLVAFGLLALFSLRHLFFHLGALQ